jgi:hypothetical protein
MWPLLAGGEVCTTGGKKKKKKRNFPLELIGRSRRESKECCETIDSQLGLCRGAGLARVFAGESF